jgi:hypothetical protein
MKFEVTLVIEAPNFEIASDPERWTDYFYADPVTVDRVVSVKEER